MITIKSTKEGSKFVSQRFESLDTVEKWIDAFSNRYEKLPLNIAKSLAKIDMQNAK